MLTPHTQALLCCVARDQCVQDRWSENLSKAGEDIKEQSNMLEKLARMKIKTGAISLAPSSNNFASSHPLRKGIKKNNMSSSKKSSLTHASLS